MNLNEEYEHELPSGTYYIVDPCYVLDEDKYDELLQTVDDKIIYINGVPIVAYYTHHGDGEFQTTVLTHYNDVDLLSPLIDLPVDSGLIAIIPEELVSDDMKDDYDEPVYIKVHYDKKFKTHQYNDGMLSFGAVTVHTGFCEEEPILEDYFLESEKNLDHFNKILGI